MEKNYVVMTDSSADLNPALEQELGVDMIPLSVNCGDRTFLDYPDEREIKTSEFYGMLRSGANAKTAAANVNSPAEFFEPNPPPMYSQTTRTLSAGMPSSRATSLRTPHTYCVDV